MKNSNRPAHQRSLIRVFVVRMQKLCILGYHKCKDSDLCSECWTHISECTFLTLQLKCQGRILPRVHKSLYKNSSFFSSLWRWNSTARYCVSWSAYVWLSVKLASYTSALTTPPPPPPPTHTLPQTPTPVVYSTDRSKVVVPVLVLLFVALWFILRGDLFYVLPCVILFLCFFFQSL